MPPVNDPPNPYYKVYQALIAGGLTDAWNKDDPGFTYGQDPDLLNPDSKLSFRIDLVLYRGGSRWDFDVGNIELVGDKQADKTPSGLWPSDHAGVVATLRGGTDGPHCLPLGASCTVPGVGCCAHFGETECSNNVCVRRVPPPTCHGHPTPTQLCSTQWTCCDPDGWVCGNCR